MATTTTPDLPALWREYERLAAEYNSQPDEAPDDSPLWDSWMEVSDAIAAARPTDLQGIVAQMRWLAHQATMGTRTDRCEAPMLARLADRLEELAAGG